MDVIRIEQVVRKDGEITVTGLPFKRGQKVELILFPEPSGETQRKPLNVGQLRESGIIGMWKDRTDIQDSACYSRDLRKRMESR